ncbi:hypothetical protein Nepgr_026685 [Nepenthes gracilis]|uniref:Uncharacterized protein n=1 Tax=Nepenthes gracilis TaxID=150966 RepID=A0AAD3TA78_NEPGR|nr:hypothetical protein Nepgr_026685 [Nepenthes gracilis]
MKHKATDLTPTTYTSINFSPAIEHLNAAAPNLPKKVAIFQNQNTFQTSIYKCTFRMLQPSRWRPQSRRSDHLRGHLINHNNEVEIAKDLAIRRPHGQRYPPTSGVVTFKHRQEPMRHHVPPERTPRIGEYKAKTYIPMNLQPQGVASRQSDTRHQTTHNKFPFQTREMAETVVLHLQQEQANQIAYLAVEQPKSNNILYQNLPCRTGKRRTTHSICQ